MLCVTPLPTKSSDTWSILFVLFCFLFFFFLYASQYNEIPYNKDPGITNDIFQPSYSKMNGTSLNPAKTNSHGNKRILPVPWQFQRDLHLIVLFELVTVNYLRSVCSLFLINFRNNATECNRDHFCFFL